MPIIPDPMDPMAPVRAHLHPLGMEAMDRRLNEAGMKMTHYCGSIGCPGHSSYLDRCAKTHKCDKPDCPGHDFPGTICL